VDIMKLLVECDKLQAPEVKKQLEGTCFTVLIEALFARAYLRGQYYFTALAHSKKLQDALSHNPGNIYGK
jgi:hypothetical protein